MMSVVSQSPPPFFRRGPAPLARFIFFATLSLALLVVDLRFKYLEVLRQVISVVTYPLQQAALAPVHAASSIGAYFSTVNALQDENASLRRRHTELAAVLLRQDQLEQENQRMRNLLAMMERQSAKGVVAEIVYGARDPFSHKVFIDKGSQQGLVAGEVVVDDRGVIGQVTRVLPVQSEVTLISDKDQSVPVQVVRNGLRAVVSGSEQGFLELRFLAANADVQNGDELVTSGLDGVFLPGLPVAKVVRVERDNIHTFARILCQPKGAVDQYGLVLVLEKRVLSVEPPPPEAKPEKKGKGKSRRSKRQQ
ncbi:MAG: rod shape-determining protein MreC [Rhodocyclaceae bacterium]